MDLEKLVPLQNTCDKLKELGWNIETYLVWVKHNAFDEGSWKPEEANRYGYEGLEDRFYAPTASELGEVLPFLIKGKLWGGMKWSLNFVLQKPYQIGFIIMYSLMVTEIAITFVSLVISQKDFQVKTKLKQGRCF